MVLQTGPSGDHVMVQGCQTEPAVCQKKRSNSEVVVRKKKSVTLGCDIVVKKKNSDSVTVRPNSRLDDVFWVNSPVRRADSEISRDRESDCAELVSYTGARSLPSDVISRCGESRDLIGWRESVAGSEDIAGKHKRKLGMADLSLVSF